MPHFFFLTYSNTIHFFLTIFNSMQTFLAHSALITDTHAPLPASDKTLSFFQTIMHPLSVSLFCFPLFKTTTTVTVIATSFQIFLHFYIGSNIILFSFNFSYFLCHNVIQICSLLSVYYLTTSCI